MSTMERVQRRGVVLDLGKGVTIVGHPLRTQGSIYTISDHKTTNTTAFVAPGHYRHYSTWSARPPGPVGRQTASISRVKRASTNFVAVTSVPRPSRNAIQNRPQVSPWRPIVVSVVWSSNSRHCAFQEPEDKANCVIDTLLILAMTRYTDGPPQRHAEGEPAQNPGQDHPLRRLQLRSAFTVAKMSVLSTCQTQHSKQRMC